MKRLFAILAEPASYTVDRNKYVYDKLGIDYAYMHSNSAARAENVATVRSYDQLSFAALLKEMCRILKAYDGVIMNGYNNRAFAALFLANFFYCRPIGIDSDTQLIVPKQLVKRLLKWLYLHFLFTRKWMYGLPGGNYVHRDLFRKYGMKEERIFLMPMMVNNEKFYYKESHDTNPFVFLFVGRIIALKNLDVLCDAFKKAYEGNESVLLRIVGEGSELDSLMQKYSCISNISFEGPKFGKDLIDVYRSSNVLVLPSYFEQWGLVVNEAMSAGLPVIVSDKVGSRYDLVQERETGFVFYYDSVDQLIAHMLSFTNDKELYKRFSHNAYTLMHDYWNYSLYTECLEKFAESI